MIPQNVATDSARFSLQDVTNNKLRDETLQAFMLVNDSTTVAVEVPIVLTAKDAGIETALGCHTFRATGITVYLQNGGTLVKAQMMAAHKSARTTKLYDRTSDQISLEEVERIVF